VYIVIQHAKNILTHRPTIYTNKKYLIYIQYNNNTEDEL